MEDNGGLLRLSRLSAHYAGRGSAAASPPSPLFAPLPDAVSTTFSSSPSPGGSPYLLRSPLASQQRRDRSWSPSRDDAVPSGSAVPGRRAGKKTLLLAFELAPGRKVTVPLEFAASVPVGASSVRGAARSAIRREAARARVPGAPPRLDYVSVFCDATRRWVELEAFPLPLLEAQQLYAFGEGGGPDADARGFIPPPRPATRALSPREVRTQQLQEQQPDTLTVHVAGDVGGRRINVPRVVSSTIGAAAVRAVAAAALEEEARRRVNAAVDVGRVLVRGYDGRWRELLTGAGLSDGAQLYALQPSEAAPPAVIPESRDDGCSGAGLVVPASPLALGSPAAAASVFSPAAAGSPRGGRGHHLPLSLTSPGRATVERWSGAAAPSPLPPYASPLRLCDRGAGAPALTPRAAVRGTWASKYSSEGGGGGGAGGGNSSSSSSSTAAAVARRGTGGGTTRSGVPSTASCAGEEGRETVAATSVASVVEESSVVGEESVAEKSAAATSVAPPPTATPASTRPPDPPLPPPSLSTDEGGGSGSDGSSTRQASASPLDIPG